MFFNKTGIWIISFFLLIVSCTRGNETVYPLLGKDPLQDVSLIEEQGEALALWAEKEIEKAVLVHFDPYSDYLAAAVQQKMVKKIYWVLPYLFFEKADAGEMIKEFLRSSEAGLQNSEIDAMKMETGCLTGILRGYDMHICSLRTLPTITEPVLVSIDVSFFPVYAREYKISKLRALKWFFDQMTFRQMRSIYATISYSIESGLTEPIYRYIGDELLEGLRNPQVLEADAPPELWQFRDQAENMLSGGEDKLVEEFLADPLLKYPDDLPLRLMNASAKVLLKRFDEAFREADEICRKDKHYCYGFVYLGSLIAEDEKNEWREKFFQEALKVLPDSNYVKRKVSKEL